MNEAWRAKAEDGIVLVVVGVGEDTLAMELEAMATSPTTLFNVSDFSALFDIAEALSERICLGGSRAGLHTTSNTSSLPPSRNTSSPALASGQLISSFLSNSNVPPQKIKTAVRIYR